MSRSSGQTRKVPTRRVRWQTAYRLIPSIYPPIALFERTNDSDDWDAIYELESLTNPRVREDIGDLSIVPRDRRVYGPGATIVMAPFTHATTERPTRFSDGSFGVYYCAREFLTALSEVVFHATRFLTDAGIPPIKNDYRAYAGRIDKSFHDITKGNWATLLDPDTAKYAPPQAFAKTLRDGDSNGIVYPSVRHTGGQCVAAFWPDTVGIPVQERHIALKWNGETITDWFDYAADQWQQLS